MVDWNLVKKITLLHDLGNIVKFDFDKHPEFLGEERVRVDYWKDEQRKVVEKYGSDDHEATKKMLSELGVSSKIIETILNKSFGNTVSIARCENWPLKILSYADLRVLPSGVGSLEDRFNDVRTRMPKYVSRPDFEDLLDASRDIENQIAEYISVSVSDINSESIISVDRSDLLGTEI